MTTERKGLTRAEAEALLTARDKLGVAAPTRGVNVGGGRHVEVQETWDGTGKVPIGWSGVSGVYEDEEQEEVIVSGKKVISYRKLGTYSLGLAEDTEERLAVDAILSDEEKTLLSDEIEKARKAKTEVKARKT